MKHAVIHIKVFRERCLRTQEQLQGIQMTSKNSWDLDSELNESTHINNITRGKIFFENDEKVKNIYELESVEEVEDLDEDLIRYQEEDENAEDMRTDILDDTGLDIDSTVDSVENELHNSKSRESVEEFEEISVNDLNPSFSNLIDFASESAETNQTGAENKKIFVASSSYDCGENNLNNSRRTKVKKKRYTNWKNLTEEQVIERKRQQRLRDFICEQCGRHFTDQSNFKLHMLRHTGIKNFQCKECPKRFYTEHLLQWHERIVHQDEHPYPCRYCDKTFKNSTGRLVHER